MGNKKMKHRAPITQERIFLIVMIITIAVSIVFLVKNLLGGNGKSAVIIGVCVVAFCIIIFVLHKLKAPKSVQMMILSVLLVALVLLISLTSGDYYSDDFPLFLALLALTGLYLEPKCTLVQSLAIDVALVVMYIVHPEKTESAGQYFMCVAIFNIAWVLNFMVIRRGRAFIDLANAQSDEARKLLASVQSIGDSLQASHESSEQRIADMGRVEEQLNTSTLNLRDNSAAINRESGEVTQACAEAYTCVQATGDSIVALNEAVDIIEGALADSRGPMEAMDTNLNRVKDIIHETGEVFEALRQQMVNISGLTEQLGSIAFNTRMLALNASIEAARAGQYGAGFSVVANEVQALAANSDACSTQVTEVVEAMQKQVEISARQIEESTKGIALSMDTLSELEGSIRSLLTPFQTLHTNLETQNENISNLDTIFENLNVKVGSMSTCSADNHEAVQSIMEALALHKRHIDLILGDTKQIHALSASILDASGQDK